MRSYSIRKTKSGQYLSIILLFITSDIICDNFIFRSFNKQSQTFEFLLFLSLLLLQIFASPIQSGLSDFYSRKKSLIISLSSSLISLILVSFYDQKIFAIPFLLIIITLFKGCLGNTIPLSWAAIADTQDKNFRFSFGLSTAAFAVGYLILVFSNKYLNEKEANFYVIALFILLIYLCFFHFRDIKDINHKRIKFSDVFEEFKTIYHEILKINTRNALVAFLLWEVSLYSILLLYIDFDISEFSSTAIGMMCGYLVGVLILKFSTKIVDTRMIRIGYYTSVFSLIPFLVLFPFFESTKHSLLVISYFFHTMGNAFLCPTLFAILSKEREPHQQGKIYGLIESTDTLAFLLASVTVMLYQFYKIDLMYIILFSFVTIAISWLPYIRFEAKKQ